MSDRFHAIWNPCTNEFKYVPPTIMQSNTRKECSDEEDSDCSFGSSDDGKSSDILYGFGYDSRIDDYKLVKIVQYYNFESDEYYGSRVHVYTLGIDSWRRIENLDIYLRKQTTPACVNGTLNWRTGFCFNDHEFIVSFDIVDESFCELPIPENIMGIIHVGGLEGNLCLLDGVNCIQSDLWVMKDYGVRDSWIKLFTINQLPGMQHNFLKVLCFYKAGLVLLMYDHRHLLLFDPKLGKAEILRTLGAPDMYLAQPYVGSLVSLQSGTYVAKSKHVKEIHIERGKMRKNAPQVQCKLQKLKKCRTKN